MNAKPLLYLYGAGPFFSKWVIPLMVCFFLLFCSGAARGQTDDLKGDLAMVLKLVKAGISKPGYMEEKLISTTDKLPGWEGTTISLYQYHMYDAKTKTTKSAKVYLADAADELMARWIISACRAVKKEVKKAGCVETHQADQWSVRWAVPGTGDRL